MKKLLAVALSLILMGCAGSKMSVVQNSRPISQSITRIAIAPGSGLFADAIGIELSNMGFQVVDANEVEAIIDRAELKRFELYTPKGNAVLRKWGIEAIIAAKAIAVNGTPESASVKITDTRDGSILVGITWQNGWGGMRGSIADRTMRKNLSEAAQDIAKELAKRLRH